LQVDELIKVKYRAHNS